MPPSHSLKILLNIIFPSTPGYSKCTLSLSFPHQYLVYTCPHPIHGTYAAHIIFLYLITRKVLGKSYRSLSSSLCTFLHSPVTSSLLDPNTLLKTLFSNTLSLCSSLNVSDQVSHPYKRQPKFLFCTF